MANDNYPEIFLKRGSRQHYLFEMNLDGRAISIIPQPNKYNHSYLDCCITIANEFGRYLNQVGITNYNLASEVTPLNQDEKHQIHRIMQKFKKTLDSSLTDSNPSLEPENLLTGF